MDHTREVEKALEKVRLARVAYEKELDSSSDAARMKELKTELYEAEGALVRLKRSREPKPPSHLL